MMQSEHSWDCKECRFSTLFEWEFQEHIKETGHKKGRFSMPFSRWVIQSWLAASATRRVAAAISSLIYVILLVTFIGYFVPITVVFGLSIWIILKADFEFSGTGPEDDSD